MRYQSNNRKAIRYLSVLTYCIVFIISELNNYDVDLEFGVSEQIFTSSGAEFSSHKNEENVDVIIHEAISEDITADFLLGTINAISGKLSYHKDILTVIQLYYSPLILFMVLIILLSQCYVNRMYLIHFIHNSDGEKGKILI